jgi:hypothetical protein
MIFMNSNQFFRVNENRNPSQETNFMRQLMSDAEQHSSVCMPRLKIME